MAAEIMVQCESLLHPALVPQYSVLGPRSSYLRPHPQQIGVGSIHSLMQFTAGLLF